MRGRMRAATQLGITEAPLHGRAVDEPPSGSFLTWEFTLGYKRSDALKGQSKWASSVSGRQGVVQ